MKRVKSVSAYLLLCAVLLAPVTAAYAAGKQNKDLPPAAPRRGLGGKETPGLLEKHLKGALSNVEEIIFAVRGSSREWHFFASTGYDCNNPKKEFWSLGPGALMALNLRTKETRVILDDPKGAVRYPCVSYDGGKILFSYRKGDSKVYHLYEINADGAGLRQITDGPFDDVEPVYVPDGGIVFSSARCRRYVPCFTSQVQMLHRCEIDGSGIRALSAGQENELTPWVMPDGQIIYMRWEYVERQVRTYHHLWTIRPDGTNEMVFFGNGSNSYVSASGSVVITDAKPIPDTNKVIAISQSRHGAREYSGAVTIIDPSNGPNDWRNIKYLTDDPRDYKGTPWRDPYPFSDDCFILASQNALYVMDGNANYEKIYEGRTMLHEPRPLVSRERETIIPSQVDLSKKTGTCIVSEAHVGRNLEELKPGTVKNLMIIEVLPGAITNMGRFRGTGSNLKRVIGAVPVEKDGSAHFEVPSMRAVMFVLLDENNRAIKRMRSFTTLMPGETTSCVGCHEQRSMIKSPPSQRLLALQRPASTPLKPAGMPPYGIVDYARDIQPILDKHCVECHSDTLRKGGISLSGGVTPNGYIGISALSGKTPLGGNVRGNDPPYKYGSGASPLLDMLEKEHKKVKLTEEEFNMFRLWIDTGMWNHGTHAAMAPKHEARYSTTDDPRGKKMGYPLIDADILERRCDSCHEPRKDKRRKRVYRKMLDDKSVNFTKPENSLILLAPLAVNAGGLGLCRGKGAEGGSGKVFADREDPDYRALLAEIEKIKKGCYPRGFHFREGFTGCETYIREMKRYGVLPEDFDPDTPIDPWETDQRYYELFYPKP